MACASALRGTPNRETGWLSGTKATCLIIPYTTCVVPLHAMPTANSFPDKVSNSRVLTHARYVMQTHTQGHEMKALFVARSGIAGCASNLAVAALWLTGCISRTCRFERQGGGTGSISGAARHHDPARHPPDRGDAFAISSNAAPAKPLATCLSA